MPESEELRPCPFCEPDDHQLITLKGRTICDACKTDLEIDWWQSRPIEDALRAKLDRIREALKKADNTGLLVLEMTVRSHPSLGFQSALRSLCETIEQETGGIEDVFKIS